MTNMRYNPATRVTYRITGLYEHTRKSRSCSKNRVNLVLHVAENLTLLFRIPPYGIRSVYSVLFV